MHEYGVSFIEIEEQWTDRQLAALMQAMAKRYEKQNKARGVTRKTASSPAEFAASAPGYSYRSIG